MKYFFGFLLSVAASLLFLSPVRADALPRRDLFVTVIQEPQILASRQAIADLVAYAKQAGIGTLFVQVYRANQSWFPSKVADQSPYEICLKNVGEDPFALLIKQAHNEGIQVHAWINLLSLSKNRKSPLLKQYGASILTRSKQKKKNLDDYQIDQQFFLEPGDPRVRTALLSMVGELVRTYPSLDGVQFDYIRYPDQDPHYGYTPINIDRFKKASGQDSIDDDSKIWKDWKRAQVTALLQRLIKKVRFLRPDIKVSTTGCSPYTRAFDEAFQDWPSWVNTGLVDFVTVMTYAADTTDFDKFMADALVRVTDPKRLNIAVGAYQQIKSPERFMAQLDLCRKVSSGSCVIFHYGSLLESSALKDSLIK
ncbi:MAG: family 10 glycosylhydrolase [Candidatus Omnitrophica bacterium]|nr:family 10 glycosylhydrolase [Candidatus Omnitrophota bacterium]